MTLKEQFKNEVKRIKRETGLTQDEIAKELGYSRVYLSELMGSRGKMEQSHLDLLRNTTFTKKEEVVKTLSNITPQAWENLTESVLHLSIGVRKGQENIGALTSLLKGEESNSDASPETYSDEVIEAFLEKLAQKWEGRKVPTQIEFVTYAKKVLASVHFGVGKDKDQKDETAKHQVLKG